MVNVLCDLIGKMNCRTELNLGTVYDVGFLSEENVCSNVEDFRGDVFDGRWSDFRPNSYYECAHPEVYYGNCNFQSAENLRKEDVSEEDGYFDQVGCFEGCFDLNAPEGNSSCSNASGDSFSRIKANGMLAKLNVPCKEKKNWDYDHCYSYYANGCYNTCQFVKFTDIEDFM